jgi:hypothetical protein
MDGAGIDKAVLLVIDFGLAYKNIEQTIEEVHQAHKKLFGPVGLLFGVFERRSAVNCICLSLLTSIGPRQHCFPAHATAFQKSLLRKKSMDNILGNNLLGILPQAERKHANYGA